MCFGGAESEGTTVKVQNDALLRSGVLVERGVCIVWIAGVRGTAATAGTVVGGRVEKFTAVWSHGVGNHPDVRGEARQPGRYDTQRWVCQAPEQAHAACEMGSRGSKEGDGCFEQEAPGRMGFGTDAAATEDGKGRTDGKAGTAKAAQCGAGVWGNVVVGAGGGGGGGGGGRSVGGAEGEGGGGEGGGVEGWRRD